MEPKLLRLAYIAEFLLALIAVFNVWSQVGGQTHLDLMAWYLKLFFGVAMAYAVVRATRAAIESERAWNGRVLTWLTLVGLLAVGAGVITYYYHVYEPRDEEDQPTTQTSIVPEKSTRAARCTLREGSRSNGSAFHTRTGSEADELRSPAGPQA